jgi:hypothetical protein
MTADIREAAERVLDELYAIPDEYEIDHPGDAPGVGAAIRLDQLAALERFAREMGARALRIVAEDADTHRDAYGRVVVAVPVETIINAAASLAPPTTKPEDDDGL